MKQYIQSAEFKRVVVLVNQYGDEITELEFRDGFYHITEDIRLDIGDVLKVVEYQTEVD